MRESGALFICVLNSEDGLLNLLLGQPFQEPAEAGAGNHTVRGPGTQLAQSQDGEPYGVAGTPVGASCGSPSLSVLAFFFGFAT